MYTGLQMPTNVWMHLAATFDGATFRFYTNGVLCGTGTGTLGTTNTDPMTNGSAGGCVGFPGLLDEVALYNRALSPVEIQAIYYAQALDKCPTPPAIFTQPQSRTVPLGTNVTFTAGIIGSNPLFYQWRSNNVALAGATNGSLTLSNVQPSFAADYSLLVSNGLSFAASSNATLKVTVVYVFGNGQLLTNSQYSFSNSVSLQLSNSYAGGLMFYTLDGSTPSFASPGYSGAFVVTQNTTIRTLGYSADFSQSGQSDPLVLIFPPIYTLTATTAGGGTIALNPPGGTYLSNSVVGITGVTNAGWGFLQWTGDATGTNRSNSAVMNGNRAVQALFGTALGTTAAGGGSVLRNPTGVVYPYGTTIQLSAVPQAGNQFAVWGNAAGGNLNPLGFVVTNANPTVSSLFVPLSGGQVALTVIPVGHGTVAINPQANAYTPGANVTVTATAETNQTFLGWSGDATGTQNPLSVTMDQSRVIYANFSKIYNLTLQPTASGFQLSLTGEVATAYQFGRSTNMSVWTPLGTLTNFTGTLQYFGCGHDQCERAVLPGLVLP